MPPPTPPPIAVARAVVGPRKGDPDAGEPDERGLPPMVLTLYRQPDGDGTYSLVMQRGSEGRR